MLLRDKQTKDCFCTAEYYFVFFRNANKKRGWWPSAGRSGIWTLRAPDHLQSTIPLQKASSRTGAVLLTLAGTPSHQEHIEQ